jgi:putative ABC transport system permease protein
MFFRLLMESFRRQRRRKLLAGIAILLGTTAVTAMLALATTIGDRIHKELAVYGANIVVYPKADLLDVKVGGVDVKPASGGAYLKESELAKLKTIFWGNNITGVSPELPVSLRVLTGGGTSLSASGVGLWFNHPFTETLKTGAPGLHPWWKIIGQWPSANDQLVVGSDVARKLSLHQGSSISIESAGTPAAPANPGQKFAVSGVISTGDVTDGQILLPLASAQALVGAPDEVRRVEVSARTKPEDAFARVDPDSLPPKQREIW